jgi:hypothetical protein
MDYIQIPYCQARKNIDTLSIRFYNEPNEDRTLRKWYGNFILLNQTIGYKSNAT